MAEFQRPSRAEREVDGRAAGAPPLNDFDEATDVDVAVSAPSPWLYLAGLCVTLAGLYAVNYGSPDQNFTLLTVALAVCGYLASYILRVRRISVQSLQTPALVVLGLTVLAMLSSERGLGWLMPQGEESDRGRILQFMFAWLAIAHSYLLANDAAVLFACVPCMTMLALVSTRNSDPEIQNAFLAFIAGSTFMMVHENYLRTRLSQQKGRSRGGEQRFFGGQLQLTALCLVGALFLANFVAVPIRVVGQTLFDSGILNQNSTKTTQTQHISSTAQSTGEQDEIDLGGGPPGDSTAPIMLIKSPQPFNWRGKTFAVYTGTKFINFDADSQPTTIQPLDQRKLQGGRAPDQFVPSESPTFQSTTHTFELPQGSVEMAGVDPHNRETITQWVTVLATESEELYGAASISRVTGHFDLLTVASDRAVMSNPLAVQKATYGVVSNVPKTDAGLLHAASSAARDIPAEIRQTFLETRVWSRATRSWLPESKVLRDIVDAKTARLTNNYDKAQAVLDYIRETCLYTLRPKPTPAGKDVVEYFLTDQKRGYCTSFAAAMTMLARYAGIPARLASGYLSGEDQGDHTYKVLDKQKHVWAELYFPGIGWVPYDATEGAADAPDEDNKQRDKGLTFMAWFLSHGWLPPVTGLLIVGLLAYLLKTELLDRLGWTRVSGNALLDFPATNREIVHAYLTGCDLLRRRGLPRQDHQTANEYAVRIRACAADRAGEVSAIWDELTDLFMRCRYSTAVATAADVEAATEALTRLRRALASLPRGVLSGATA
jgi:hypothetical protein